MKISASLKFFLALLLCITPVSMSAQDNAADCAPLRNKIAQLEKLDIKTMSPTMQQLYKESLLKLYMQFSRCVQREISHATDMQKSVAGTDAAPGVENALRTLAKDKSDIDAKITVLTTALNFTDAEIASAMPQGATRASGELTTPPLSVATPRRGAATSPTPADSAATTTTTATATTTTTAAAAPRAPAQATPVCTTSAAYDDAPGILKDIANKAAADVVRTSDPDRAIRPGAQMVLYAVFDAASPTSSKLVRGLEAYQYLGETARTDKQLGASAKSDGAVSAIEKPGFARLLGFAVEHGGITKKNDGTNLTLSTSLYSLYTLNGGDTSETYERAGILNRVGVAASFAVDNKDDDLANARRKNLSEWSVKARLFGDRSTRSAGFQKFWDQEIRPLISARLQTLGKSVNELSDKIDAYDALESEALDRLPDLVRSRFECADYKAATVEGKQKIIGDLILAQLKTQAYDPVKTGRVALSAEEVSRIEGEFLPGLKSALDNLVVGRRLLEQRVDDLKKAPLGTFAYTNHRQPLTSDYSEAKFLFEQDKSFFRPLKLTANFGLSFYHKPNRALNQEKLRDISAALSFEGTSRSPFTEGENQSKITYSFVGRYERLMENRRMANRKPDIATAQFVMEIPFVKGFSLPLSLSYANATEEERKKNVRFNFGMRLDTDKLFELLRTTSLPR